ncbi:MAG: hypothetical protein R6W71_05590 [Bacteroidales bacterium]
MPDFRSIRPEIKVRPAFYLRKYDMPGNPGEPCLEERITVSPDKPVAMINYRYDGRDTAEFRNNNYLQGFAHLSSNLKIWKHWGLGFMEEVLNGEVSQPSGVCHHQFWSETMALQPVIEGMLGYRPDAVNRKIYLKPWFPELSGAINVTRFSFTKKSGEWLDVQLSPVLPPGSQVDKITVNGLPARDWGVRKARQEFRVWGRRTGQMEA